MEIEIKNRYTEEVIYSCKANSLRKALEKAVSEGADLAVADLRGANLRKAKLSGANLAGANLAVADLAGANLWGANLWKANLAGANLAGANLNAIFYKTKITKEQKEIIDKSDLWEIENEN